MPGARWVGKIGDTKLTEHQLIFVRKLAAGGTAVDAATLAGYSQPEVEASRLLRQSGIQKALFEERQKLLDALAGEAIRTMGLLMKEGQPATVRFTAAKWLAESAGHGPKQPGSGSKGLLDKDPSEMTEAELGQILVMAQAVLDRGSRPMIDVTPTDSAEDSAEVAQGDEGKALQRGDNSEDDAT